MNNKMIYLTLPEDLKEANELFSRRNAECDGGCLIEDIKLALEK